ncbi:MAG: hypothetical protein M1608_10810 [Candidatus Omnitrophica bacterium]|nr:hypothetical protein [Candidatus Omnitrophota bacterium]
MNSRWRVSKTQPGTRAVNMIVAELEGLVGLGMKGQALRLVRRHFRGDSIDPDSFCAGLNAILTVVDGLKPWRPLVEAAYQKLSKRGKRQSRYMMLYFYCSLHDYKAAYHFLPRRFVGPMSAADLMFALDTLLALGRLEEAKPVVRKAVNALDSLGNVEGRAMLVSSIAEYLSEVHAWEPAIRLWEGLQKDSLMAESAIFGLLNLHLHRIRQTIRSARDSLKHLRHNPDPEIEIVLPGNDAARWRSTGVQLDRIERWVNRALAAFDSRTGGSSASITHDD